ncbi:MAG: sulfide dehydrogenase [Actinomycetia bacterium]|nr:sulfide dehydrogenase [Actinomycetes bacterium]
MLPLTLTRGQQTFDSPVTPAARCIDSALVRRLLPLAIFLVFAAGCSVNKPGEKVVAPLPSKVVGTVPKAQVTSVPTQYKNGDPVAGKQVFESAGCKGCHTLKDAGATGTVGPNLDQVKPPLSKVVPQVLNGGPQMPPFKGSLSAKQIADVAAYVVKATGGNPNG